VGAELEAGVGSLSPIGGIRSILFPPDLVAVVPWPRIPRPPAPVKRVMPWRPRPAGEPIERARGGAWFSDRIFVEAKPNRVLSGLSTSIGTHALVIALAAALPSRVALTPIREVESRMVMPATLVVGSIAHDSPVQTTGFTGQSPHAPVAAAPPAASGSAVAPIEEPSSIEPEQETGTVGRADGVEGGVAGGIDEGSGETASGSGGSAGALHGPLRIGGAIGPPRKIKDVKPLYPQLAVFQQARGTVVVEITIGTDGKVQDARIVHSDPRLDEAALDAVRQWEYEPTRVNGVLVALTMTVIVNFTIQ
jgi:periplasmic protein TonB